MNAKILNPTWHGALDYLAATGLILLPLLLGLEQYGPQAKWLSIAGGVGLVGYSLLTDYGMGALRVIPLRLHLAFDLAAAAVFAVAPFVFGWQGLAMAYYVTMAVAVVIVVLLTNVEAMQDHAVANANH